jgi:hypothetical protein
MTKRKDESKTLKWRNSAQLRGVRSQVQAAINACTDGASVALDLTTALNVIEVIKQAEHTETGHGC